VSTKDAVVVLAYWRPDYIGKCLECLLACPEISDTEVFIFQDSRKSLPANRAELFPVTTEIIENYVHRFAHAAFSQQPDHTYHTDGSGKLHPNTFNLRVGLKRAYESGAERMYLVCDDVLVTPDFLRWHKAVQQDGDYPVTCSARLPSQEFPILPEHDLNAYYQSPIVLDNGLCWRRDKLAAVVNARATEIMSYRFPYFEKPMIPFVQRSYHVGKRSAALYEADFCICGDVDSIPEKMPEYEWSRVRRA
jgi:hypothetical protein